MQFLTQKCACNFTDLQQDFKSCPQGSKTMKGDLFIAQEFLPSGHVCPLRMWRWKLSHIKREDAGPRKGLQKKHR